MVNLIEVEQICVTADDGVIGCQYSCFHPTAVEIKILAIERYIICIWIRCTDLRKFGTEFSLCI
jgi:hypothetical protein